MNVKKSLTDKEKNMFIRMKESKGFTLVELMIVVAIIGILAAVAVPYYQKYIQKARLTSKVIPGVHSIQTDLATYFSFQGVFPTQDTTLTPMYSDANTHCFTPKYTGSSATAGFQISFTIVSSGCTSLQTLWGQVITATPILANTGQTVTGWNFGGNLAASMGLSGSQ